MIDLQVLAVAAVGVFLAAVFIVELRKDWNGPGDRGSDAQRNDAATTEPGTELEARQGQ